MKNAPKDILALIVGNSAEKIAELEKEYDFTDVSVKEREEAKKWFNAEQPSSSRVYGAKVLAAYTVWLKWNPTSTGKFSSNNRGHLVRSLSYKAGPMWHRKREEESEEESEAGAAM
jgi:hypothetical protein